MGVTESITLQQALETMDGSAPFSIDFVTCNKARKTGGEWIHLDNARTHNYISKNETARLAKTQPAADVVNKDPRHYQNSTRNLMLSNGEIRKIHIRLIRKLNGKTVL